MSDNHDKSPSSLLDRFEGLARAHNPSAPTPAPDHWGPPPVGRTFRWSVVVVLLGLAAASLGVGWWLTSIADVKATERLDTYTASVAALEAALPGAVAAVAPLTDPASPPDIIEGTVVSIRAFGSASAELSRIAAEPLPRLPNGLPDEALEDLIPVRNELGLIAARAGTIADRFVKVAELRLIATDLFVIPDLPLSAESPETANNVSLALAAMVADSAAVLAELPNDPLLEEFEAAAEAHLAWLKTWQPEYVAALRRNNTTTAVTAAADLVANTETVMAALDRSLAAFGDWLSTELDAFTPGLDRTAVLVRSF